MGLLSSGASKKIKQAAAARAKGINDAQGYYRDANQIRRGTFEGALTGLNSAYGLTIDENGDVISDGSTIQDRALSDPRYTYAMQEAENSVLRNSSATGGIRGGNTNDALARTAAQQYAGSYDNQLQGLQYLTQTPTYDNQIAELDIMRGNNQADMLTALGNRRASNKALGIGALMQGGKFLASGGLQSLQGMMPQGGGFNPNLSDEYSKFLNTDYGNPLQGFGGPVQF